MTATLLRLTQNSDGSTNWWRVVLIAVITFGIPALFRCIRTVEEGERGTRTRWGRALRVDENGKKCKHSNRPKCGCNYKMVDPGAHFVVFKIHSIKVIGIKPRTTPLTTDGLTHGKKNFDYAPVIRWHVAEEDDYAGRAMFDVYDPNKKDEKNQQLVTLVEEHVSDELTRAYGRTPANEDGTPVFLKLEDFEESCQEWLLENCGVILDKLLYPKHKLADVERQKQGLEAVAAAIRENRQVVFNEDALPDGVTKLPVPS